MVKIGNKKREKAIAKKYLNWYNKIEVKVEKIHTDKFSILQA